MFQCCTHTVPLGCTGKVNHQEDMQLLSLLLRWKPLGWEESLFAEDGLVKCSQAAWLPGPGWPIHPIACGSFLRPAEKREQQHPLWIHRNCCLPAEVKAELRFPKPTPRLTCFEWYPLAMSAREDFMQSQAAHQSKTCSETKSGVFRSHSEQSACWLSALSLSGPVCFDPEKFLFKGSQRWEQPSAT